MKFLYKNVLIALLSVFMASSTVLADEQEDVLSEKENISFNYQTNMFDIDNAETGLTTDNELTVMLVKGDFSNNDVSLSQISVADVYYVGQKTGTDYDVFEDLGVRYDSGEFAPGVYTLITSGENTPLKKTKLVIGNAINKDIETGEYLPDGWSAANYSFGSVGHTVRYYPEGKDGNYIYVCYADFPAISNLEKAGFVFQNISNTQGTGTMHLVKKLSEFNLNETLAGVRSISANIQIGVQINDIPVVASDDIMAVDNIVAIPYVEIESIGG